MKIKTDLNARERKRFAAILRGLSNSAGEAANALETGDDTEFMVSFLSLMIQGAAIIEIKNAITDSLEKKPEKMNEFPEILEEKCESKL